LPTGFSHLLEQLPPGLLRGYALVELPCDHEPWLDTGIDLSQGEAVTSFAAGRTVLKGTDLWFAADFQLWFRMGEDGEVFRGTRASHSFCADRPSRLYLGSYFPGEWSTRQGAIAMPGEVYQRVEGSLTVLLLRWACEPALGLQALLAVGDVDGWVAGELDRLHNPVPPPAGWYYLWFIGPAEIYQSCQRPDHAHAICCHTRNDTGLLQKDILLPLSPDMHLRWAWRMETLPSALREDNLAHHDYLSIAVEFDNGQDLTYYWSAELPPETAYRCPIPTWTGRETHLVVRSGPQGLGEWLNERRNVYADYQKAIGGEMPAHIVRVWLIAVSLFQHSEGKCQYADIAFEANGEVWTV
jgi:hypothetical protein